MAKKSPDKTSTKNNDPDKSESISKKLSETDIFNERILGNFAKDLECTEDERHNIEKHRKKLSGNFYSRLIQSLVDLEYNEKEAEKLWEILLEHKYIISKSLGRNVGIKVAAIDYFTNIADGLKPLQVVNKQSFLETTEMAICDGLTGLFNHRYFYDSLRKEIQVASNDNTPLSIVIFDIDYFKEYNDINGHVAGDVALHKVAEVIKSSIEEPAICCRYGGEEFTLILPRTGKAKAAEIADNIRIKIAGAKFPNEFVLPAGNLTISGGIAEFPLDGTDARNMVEYADRALYHSKLNGKNQVCLLAPNRRKQQRAISKLTAEIEVIPDEGEGFTKEITLVNISVGGIRCRVDCRLKINQAVKLYLPEILVGNIDPVIAVVVRCTRVEQSIWSLGLRFVRLPKEIENKISLFVSEG